MSKSIQLKDRNNNKYYPHPYYPVGSIYLSVNNTNPSRWFGGTWELISQGRTLVGVDINDTDFNTVQKTGGNKNHSHTTGNHTLTVNEMPAHNHTVYNLNNSGTVTVNNGYSMEFKSQAPFKTWGARLNMNDTGGGQAHNHGDTGSTSNLPPYFTCYIWCRTA